MRTPSQLLIATLLAATGCTQSDRSSPPVEQAHESSPAPTAPAPINSNATKAVEPAQDIEPIAFHVNTKTTGLETKAASSSYGIQTKFDGSGNIAGFYYPEELWATGTITLKVVSSNRVAEMSYTITGGHGVKPLLSERNEQALYRCGTNREVFFVDQYSAKAGVWPVIRDLPDYSGGKCIKAVLEALNNPTPDSVFLAWQYYFDITTQQMLESLYALPEETQKLRAAQLVTWQNPRIQAWCLVVLLSDKLASPPTNSPK